MTKEEPSIVRGTGLERTRRPRKISTYVPALINLVRHHEASQSFLYKYDSLVVSSHGAVPNSDRRTLFQEGGKLIV